MMASCSPNKGSKTPPLASKANRVKYGVFGAEEGCQLLLKLFMNILRAANKPHGAHAVAMTVNVFVGRFNCFWVRGKTEVIVGAKV